MHGLVCSLTKNGTVYNFNHRYILTLRDRITTLYTFYIYLLSYFIHRTILGGILVHSSLQILSKSLRFWGCRLATQKKKKKTILVSSDHITFSQASSRSSWCSLANFRRACTCAFSRGTLRTQQDFNPSWCSVLLLVLLVTVVPTAFRSLTSSSGVVLSDPWPFSSSLISHEARSCVEPQTEGDWRWLGRNAIF